MGYESCELNMCLVIGALLTEVAHLLAMTLTHSCRSSNWRTEASGSWQQSTMMRHAAEAVGREHRGRQHENHRRLCRGWESDYPACAIPVQHLFVFERLRIGDQ